MNKIKATTKIEVAREYRKKYGLDVPTLKLARIMYKDNNLLFTSLDAARSSLRYVEGKSGTKVMRESNKKNYPQFAVEDRPKNPYNLPNSDETDYKPIKLNYKKIAILNDIHIPYHSLPAITSTFDFLKKEKPDCILLNGDIIDAHSLSRFVKDPKKRNFGGELKMFKQFFEVLEKNFPYAKKILKIGNHEERYQHFLWMKAGELSDIEEFELANILKARANGIEIVSDKKIIQAGGLNIIHGHEFSSGFFSPVNIARGLYLRGKTSAIQGHNHRSSEHTEKDMNGKITTTWSIGCLCELSPAYAPINNWNWGFAIVYVDGKEFDVVNKRIYGNKIY